MTAPPDAGLSFGQWLKQRRRGLKLTQDALASRLGYTAATLQKLEQDARAPSRALAALLADALEFAPDERARFLRLAQAPGIVAPAAQPQPDSVAWRPPMPPQPPVELIGRAAERAALAEQLRSGAQRLITWVGPGGIGKTSLALQVAADLAAPGAGAPPFPDGVAWVPLTEVGTPDAVPAAIAAALGLSLAGGGAAEAQLIESLRERALLIVLDNCEQLPSGSRLVALLGGLLAAAPRLALLATSRERLRLRAEWVVALDGLDLAAPQGGPRAGRSAAVQLFLERARRVSPALAFGGDDLLAAAQICRSLEGVPLAIELAAAWTRALTPREIAVEVGRSLDLLASDTHDLADRHRSLRAALEHSWRLLGDAERAALARLALLRGGFDREAAAAVAGATLPTLAALIDKSLLRAAPAAGASRYALHALVQQYAAERLADDPAERAEAERRHTAHFAGLLQRSLGAQTGETLPEVWARLSAEGENLRAAWLRAAAAGDEATILAVAHGMLTLYDYQGRLHDAAELFGLAVAALRAAGAGGGAAAGLCLGTQGYLLYRVGRSSAAIGLLEEGAALVEAAGRDDLAARLLNHLGNVELARGRLAASREHFARAEVEAARAGEEPTRLWAIYFQGSIALYSGDAATATAFFERCVAPWRAQGYGRGHASALLGLAEVARLHGELDVAEQGVREALRITSLTHDAPAVARCLRELGAGALARGELAEARYLLTESCESLRSLNDQWAYHRSLSFLARLEVQSGDYAAAWRACVELVAGAAQDDSLRTADAAYAVALLLAAEGRPAAALAVIEALGDAPSEYAIRRQSDSLRAELERRVPLAERAAADGRPVLTLIQAHCAQALGGAPAAAPPPQAPLPAIPGGLLIVETGETLSPREIEVLRLLVAGASNQAVAESLVISPHTAKHHVASVLHKLGVATRTQAALRGRTLGLPPWP